MFAETIRNSSYAFESLVANGYRCGDNISPEVITQFCTVTRRDGKITKNDMPRFLKWCNKCLAGKKMESNLQGETKHDATKLAIGLLKGFFTEEQHDKIAKYLTEQVKK